MRNLHVVIADDHPIVLEGLAAMVEREPDLSVVAQATDGRAAVEAVLRHLPDVTLMDLRMPALDGVGAIRAIRAKLPASRIVVLTTYDGDDDVHRALEAGAVGYLLKNAGRNELLRAIRAAAAGQRVIPPNVAARMAERLSSPELTPREVSVLRLVAEGKRNREIADRLCIGEGTVKGYLKSMFSKLGVRDRTEAATTALRRGFVHTDEL